MKMLFQTVKKAPFFTSISDENWNSWHWQMRNSLQFKDDFSQVFSLSESENTAFAKGKDIFNIRTTPYYASLCGSDLNDPIRKILMPSLMEIHSGHQSQLDPLGEKKNNPTSRLIHRYADRVLFLVTDTCSVYCRYCTRKHFTGQEQAFVKPDEYEAALNYIRSHTGIREIILSGGDPLTLSDQQLEKILFDLRNIEHIEIIRIGTRMPVVCPMRITTDLVQILKAAKPVFMMLHFNHPRELTLEAKIALDLLSDNGIPLFNQMVLLRGVNNHPAIVQALSRRLLYLRVKPYYMFQCDPSQGTDYLRTSIEESEQIQRELWGHLSGLAMPNLSLDIPSGGGKVALVPNFEISRNESGRTFQGFDGVKEQYLNPDDKNFSIPIDLIQYIDEWKIILEAKSLNSGEIKPARGEHILPQIF